MRLHQIAFSMRQQMEGGQAVGAESLAGLAGFAPPTLHSLGARLGSAMSRRLFNVVITNVPGPQHPLYAGGARMLSTYPVMPLAKGQALSIGLTSYDGGVYYGLNADRDAMPDVDVLGQCLVDSLAELLESRERPAVTARARRGLVLGGGGVLGAAWMVGALRALEDELGVDLRDVRPARRDVGRVRARRRCSAAGVASRTCVATSSGDVVTTRPLAGFTLGLRGRPPAATGRRGPGPGSARTGCCVRNARHLRHLPPTAVLSALLPEGRGRLDSVGALIAPRGAAGLGAAARAAGGRAGLRHRCAGAVRARRACPTSTLPTAVMASCAIPGWYQPVRIGDHRYIDGGAWSSTNIDLLAGLGLDEVYVLAPQVSFDADRPSQLSTRLERQWRARVTRPGRCARSPRCTGTAPR